MAELSPHPEPSRVGTETGLGESVLFLVLAPAGTAGTALFHHGLAALVEDRLAFATPGRKQQVLFVPMGWKPPWDLGPPVFPSRAHSQAVLYPQPQARRRYCSLLRQMILAAMLTLGHTLHTGNYVSFYKC